MGRQLTQTPSSYGSQEGARKAQIAAFEAGAAAADLGLELAPPYKPKSMLWFAWCGGYAWIRKEAIEWKQIPRPGLEFSARLRMLIRWDPKTFAYCESHQGCIGVGHKRQRQRVRDRKRELESRSNYTI